MMTKRKAGRHAELRYNPYRDWKTGKYKSAPAKGMLTKNKKRGKIKSNTVLSKSEKRAVSSAILTDHPNLPCDGTVRSKCWGDNIYAFIVKGHGDYKFVGKYAIKGRTR